jgi:hypothetical protein
MRKLGLIQQIADACNVDAKTVRNALATAGADANTITLEDGAAIVRDIIDNVRVADHQAARVGTAGSNRMRDARARTEELKARQLELDIAEREGRLIDRDEMMVMGTHLITTTRTALLSLGHRLAAKVANKDDIKEIANIIESEVRDVLGNLADPETFFAALAAMEDEALT